MPDHDRDPEASGPVIRDRRRIDPVTGKVREPREPVAPEPAADEASGVKGPDGTHSVPPAPGGDRVTELEAKLAERTSDLQRLQAEYVNYKRRVDRDREAVRESAVASVVGQLLPVLDDVGRARDHGELEGGFKAVADTMERVLGALGLVAFAEPGDAFDPRIHEALMHSYADDVSGPTLGLILAPGYRLGDRVVRPARVAVVEPEPAEPHADDIDAAGEIETDAAAAGDDGDPDRMQD